MVCKVAEYVNWMASSIFCVIKSRQLKYSLLFNILHIIKDTTAEDEMNNTEKGETESLIENMEGVHSKIQSLRLHAKICMRLFSNVSFHIT